MEITIEGLRKLYEAGKFEEALKAISSNYRSFDETPDEILEIGALCYFRFENYKKATEAAITLVDRENLKGFELLAQLTAYVSKDDGLLSSIYERLPNNVAVCNAYAIRARDPDSKIPIPHIVCAAMDNMNGEEIASVHLLNNTARLLLAKECQEGIVMAIGFWNIALLKYGNKNYHHRAAVYFWMSKAYEKLGEKSLAIKSAEKSLATWVEQVDLDPNNPKFKESLAGAKKRLEELKCE